MAKYVITQEMIEIDGHVLFRIKALFDIDRHNIKAGQKGGFIETEANLSQEGDAWVDERACVFENAWVGGDALLYGDVIARGNSTIREEARVGGKTDIYGYAQVDGSANVHNEVCIVKDSGTCGTLLYAYRDAAWEARPSHIIICDNAVVTGAADVSGNVILKETAFVTRGIFYGNATIIGGEHRVENEMIVVPATIYNAENTECHEHDIPIVVPTIKVVKSSLTDTVAAAV